MRFDSYIRVDEFAQASARTKLQEGLHCVVFGLCQKKKKLTKEIYTMPELLEESYKKYCAVDSTFGSLYEFAMDQPSWAESVLKAANLLSGSGWLKGSSYTFHRNDAYMNSIYTQYRGIAADEHIKMANDKWNPGDVWASKMKVKIPDVDTLSEYNKFIDDNLQKSRLISISLKKIKGTGSIEPQGPGQPSEPMAFSKVKASKTVFPTGCTLMTKKAGHGIVFRSFRISQQADVQGEVIIAGTGARHGKVPSVRKNEVIEKHRIPQMPKNKIPNMSDKELINSVVELWADCGYVFPEEKIARDWKERQEDISDRTGYWQSIIHSLEIGSYMSMNSSANKIIDYWWQGAKSLTGQSSAFVKIY